MLFVVVAGIVVVVVVQYFINEAASSWDMSLSLRSLDTEKRDMFQQTIHRMTSREIVLVDLAQTSPVRSVCQIFEEATCTGLTRQWRRMKLETMSELQHFQTEEITLQLFSPLLKMRCLWRREPGHSRCFCVTWYSSIGLELEG